MAIFNGFRTALLHTHSTSALLLHANNNAFCPQLQRFCSPMSMLFFSGIGAIGKQGVSNRKTRRIQRANKRCEEEGQGRDKRKTMHLLSSKKMHRCVLLEWLFNQPKLILKQRVLLFPLFLFGIDCLHNNLSVLSIV